MSDPQATANRVEIEAIRGEFTDAVMMCDHDRLASLCTPTAQRGPLGNIEAAGREEIRAMAGGGRLSRTASCRPRTRPRRVAAPHPWRKP
jgi:hypothetical protein